MNQVLTRLAESARMTPEKRSGFSRMAFLFLAGYVLGAIVSGGICSRAQERYDLLFGGVYNLYAAPSFVRIFLRTLTADFIYYLLCAAGGLFAFGMVVVWAVVLFRGLGAGLIAGLLCISFGLNGFSFYLVAVLPGLFLSLMAFCFAASGCCGFALMHFNSYFGFGKQSLFAPPKPWKTILVCVIATILAAVIHGSMTNLFYRLLL